MRARICPPGCRGRQVYCAALSARENARSWAVSTRPDRGRCHPTCLPAAAACPHGPRQPGLGYLRYTTKGKGSGFSWACRLQKKTLVRLYARPRKEFLARSGWNVGLNNSICFIVLFDESWSIVSMGNDCGQPPCFFRTCYWILLGVLIRLVVVVPLAGHRIAGQRSLVVLKQGPQPEPGLVCNCPAMCWDNHLAGKWTRREDALLVSAECGHSYAMRPIIATPNSG